MTLAVIELGPQSATEPVAGAVAGTPLDIERLRALRVHNTTPMDPLRMAVQLHDVHTMDQIVFVA